MNFITLFFLLFAVVTTNDFQLRQIYYDYYENICANRGFDQVEINFTFEASLVKFPLVQAGTYCETWTLRIVDKIQNFDFFEVRIGEGKYVQFGVSLKKI